MTLLAFFFLASTALGTNSVIGLNESDNGIISPRIGIPTTMAQFDASIPKTNTSRVIIDGTVTSNEYNDSFYELATGMTIFWEHNGINLSVGLVSPGLGWVSMGIGAEMNGSDMIMGGIKQGSVYCYDLVGEGHFHVNDTDRGGTFDVLAYDASENATNTIFEFIIALDPNDPRDSMLQEESTYSMFFAYHASTDEMEIHSKRSTILSVLISSYVRTVETNLSMESLPPPTVQQGENITLSATLRDENQQPLENLTVEFFLETPFGRLTIYENPANSLGQVNYNYSNPTLAGNHTFGAAFSPVISPTEMYTASETTFTIYIIPQAHEEDDPYESLYEILHIIVETLFWGALAFVWGVFGVAGYCIYRIARNKKPEQPAETVSEHKKNP